jgi:hypothetical protein
MPPDLNWIEGMDGTNLLAIYDVVLDIQAEVNIAADPVRVPLFQHFVKFAYLLPVDTISARDRYCELRRRSSFFRKEVLSEASSGRVQGATAGTAT